MAARAIANVGTIQNDADSATGWSAGGLDTDSEVQGTGCVGAKTGTGVTRYNHSGTARDFSGGGGQEGDHVVVWYNFLTPSLDTFANGGIRGFCGNDTATNYKEFTFEGNETYSGGWKAGVFDPTATADFSGGTLTLSAVDFYGITYDATAGIMGNFNNGLVDQINIGTGLRCTAGDGGDTDNDFDFFVLQDEGTKNNKYGWIAEVDGVKFVQGKLYFGDGTTSTEFTDTNQTVVFKDQNVAADFYELLIDTDSTVTFGEINSGVTGNGCIFDSAGTAQYTLTVTDGGTVEAILNAYATQFRSFRQADLNGSTTMQDCTFSGGGQITQNGATITNSVVTASTVGADTGAMEVASDTDWNTNVTDVFFSNNAANANSGAIEITATGTYTFDNITFSGNSFDVINSSGGLVTINVTGGGDTPTVRNLTTSTTTVNNAVTVRVTAQDSSGSAIENARVLLEADTGGDLTAGVDILAALTNASGIVEDI